MPLFARLLLVDVTGRVWEFVLSEKWSPRYSGLSCIAYVTTVSFITFHFDEGWDGLYIMHRGLKCESP